MKRFKQYLNESTINFSLVNKNFKKGPNEGKKRALSILQFIKEGKPLKNDKGGILTYLNDNPTITSILHRMLELWIENKDEDIAKAILSSKNLEKYLINGNTSFPGKKKSDPTYTIDDVFNVINDYFNNPSKEILNDLVIKIGSDGNQNKRLFNTNIGLIGINSIQKDESFGGQVSGEPTGADWELAIVVYSNLDPKLIDSPENITVNHLNEAMSKGGVKGAQLNKFMLFEPLIREAGIKIVKEMQSAGLKGTFIHTGSDSVNSVNPYKDGTPKTDVYIKENGKYKFSMKKEGGSQLMSGLENDTRGVFYGALQLISLEDRTDKITNLTKQIIDSIDKNFKTIKLDTLSKAGIGVGKVSKTFDNWFYEKRMVELIQELNDNGLNSVIINVGKPKKDGTQKTKEVSIMDKLFQNELLKHIKYQGGEVKLTQKKPKNFVWNIKKLSQKHVTLLKGIKGLNVLLNSEDYVKEYISTIKEDDIRQETAKVIEFVLNNRKVRDEFIRLIESSNELKKYAVFEAASGCYKFGGEIIDKHSTSIDIESQLLFNINKWAIASQFLKFDIQGKSGNYIGKFTSNPTIDIAWAEKNYKGVKINVSTKSSGNFSATAFRMLPENCNKYSYLLDTILNGNKTTTFENDVNNVITETIQEYKENLLNEGIITDIKNGIKKVKDVAVSWFDIIKIILFKVINIIKSYAKNGLSYMLEMIGFELTGDVAGTINI